MNTEIIPPFSGRNTTLVRKMNLLREGVNSSRSLGGDGIISSHVSEAGTAHRISMEQLIQRLPRTATIAQGHITAVGAASFTCNLLYWSGSAWTEGAEITVYVDTVLGSNDFDGDVWPKFSGGINITIIKEADGEWYWPGVIDDTESCE